MKMRTIGMPALIAALATSLNAQAPATAPAGPTWTDGVLTLPCQAPSAGYFLPANAYTDAFQSPKDLIAKATAMTPAELKAYATPGNPLKASKQFLLLEYTAPAQERAVLWAGKGRDQDAPTPSLEVWDGSQWSAVWTPAEASAIQGSWRDKEPVKTSYVLVRFSGSMTRGKELLTAFVAIAPLPDTDEILTQALAGADALAWVPQWPLPEAAGQPDVLKGTMTGEDLKKALYLMRFNDPVALLLHKSRQGWQVDGWLSGKTPALTTRFGSYSLRDAYDAPVRWSLSRRLATEAKLNTRKQVVLRPVGGPAGWRTVEASLGWTTPLPLFDPGTDLLGSDGGRPLLTADVALGAKHYQLQPPQAWYAGQSDAPVRKDVSPKDLPFEFAWIFAGREGVAKLALKPKAAPAELTVTMRIDKLAAGTHQVEATYKSEPVVLTAK